jgi:hypothetical protein
MSQMFTEEQMHADYLQYVNSRPRPVPSRTVSSIHGFKSGFDAEEQFVYGEDRLDFFLLQKEYFDRFQPASPEERFQVDNLIRSEWSLRRLFRAETHLWEYHSTLSNRSNGVPLGEGFHRASEVFMRMQRRIGASERAYEKAYGELGRLQGMRTSASNPALNFAGLQPQLNLQPCAPQPLPFEPQAKPAAPQPAAQPLQPDPLPPQPPQPEAQPAQTHIAAAPLEPPATVPARAVGYALACPATIKIPAAAAASASASGAHTTSAAPVNQPGTAAANPTVPPYSTRFSPPRPPRDADPVAPGVTASLPLIGNHSSPTPNALG